LRAGAGANADLRELLEAADEMLRKAKAGR
jgi:hypothetical protein